MSEKRDNNTWRVRGRVVRDPYFADKDGRTTAVLFTVVSTRPFVNGSGDEVTANDYVEVKVFKSEVIQQLRDAGFSKDSVVIICARAQAELNTFERDGVEQKQARLVAVVESNDAHEIVVERLGEAQAA